MWPSSFYYHLAQFHITMWGTRYTPHMCYNSSMYIQVLILRIWDNVPQSPKEAITITPNGLSQINLWFPFICCVVSYRRNSYLSESSNMIRDQFKGILRYAMLRYLWNWLQLYSRAESWIRLVLHSILIFKMIVLLVQINLNILLNNDCYIRVSHLFCSNTSYYTGIMLDAFRYSWLQIMLA